MKRNLLKALFAVVAFVFGVNLTWAADPDVLSPTQSTVIQGAGTAGNQDVVLYGQDLHCSQSKISGNTFYNSLSNYEGSPVVITKFDASSVLSGKTITSATLKFYSKCTVSGRNSNVQVALIGTGWDATTATWNNTNTAEIMDAVAIHDGGDGKGGTNINSSGGYVTVDVKDYLAADDDKVIGFAIYTYTGRDQAISELTLTIEAADASAMTTYTVNFKDEEGNILKDAVQHDVVIGEKATATEEDMAAFFDAEKTQKYIYVSGNQEITAESNAESNVINLVFRKAEKWAYSVYTSVNEVQTLLASGEDFEGETIGVCYPRHQVADSTLYSIAAGDKNIGYFKRVFTLNENNHVETVTYGVTETERVAFLAEAEDIETLTVSTAENSDIRCSNGLCAYNSAEDPAVLCYIPAGTYKLYTSVWGNADTDFIFSAGENAILTAASKGYIQDYTSEEFTVNWKTAITLAHTANAARGIDFVYIQKVADAEELEDPNAPRVWAFNNMSAEDEALLRSDTEHWTEASNTRYQNSGIAFNNEVIKVNDTELTTTKGLLFTAETGKLLLGSATGAGAYMQVQKGTSFVIPGLTAGDTVRAVVQSASKSAVTITSPADTLARIVEGFEATADKHTCTLVMKKDGQLTMTGDNGDIRFFTLEVIRAAYEPELVFNEITYKTKRNVYDQKVVELSTVVPTKYDDGSDVTASAISVVFPEAPKVAETTNALDGEIIKEGVKPGETVTFTFTDKGEYLVYGENTLTFTLGFIDEANPLEAIGAKMFNEFVVNIPDPETEVATINFNDSTYEVSSSTSNAGDITELTTFNAGNLSIKVTPALGGTTPNRMWSTADGPQLRVYNGLITFKAATGKAIKKIEINNAKWNANNTLNDVVAATGEWEGNASSVVLNVAANTQINKIDVTIENADDETVLPTYPNIASLRYCDNSDQVQVKFTDAIVTSLAGENGQSYSYIQDATGGMKLNYTISSLFTEEGAKVNGSIAGKVSVYAWNYLVTLNNIAGVTTGNNLTIESGEVTSLPITLASVAELASKNDTIALQGVRYELSNLTMEKEVGDYNSTYYLVDEAGNKVVLEDEFWLWGSIPDYSTVSKMTGYFMLSYYGELQFHPYPLANIEAEIKPATPVANIKEMKDLPVGTNVKLTLKDAKVTLLEPGFFSNTIIIEDATGAVQLGQELAWADSITERGQVINGTIYCKYYSDSGTQYIVDGDSAAFNSLKADSIAPSITGKSVTIPNAKNGEYALRLVKFGMGKVVTESDPYWGDMYYFVQGNDTIALNDQFYKYMDMETWENTLPTDVKSFTGFIFPDPVYDNSYNLIGYDYFFVPFEHEALVVKEITEDYKFLPTADNVASVVAEGWVESGNFRVDNKKGNIDPATGEATSATVYEGIGVKNNNAIKSFIAYVTGVKQIIAYGVTTSSTATRTLKAIATNIDDATETTAEGNTAPNETAVVTLDLDNTARYKVEYIGFEGEKDGDIALHGVWFIAGGEIVDAISEINSNVTTLTGNVYNLNGLKVRNAGESLNGLAKGIYIINNKKVVVK